MSAAFMPSPMPTDALRLDPDIGIFGLEQDYLVIDGTQRASSETAVSTDGSESISSADSDNEMGNDEGGIEQKLAIIRRKHDKHMDSFSELINMSRYSSDQGPSGDVHWRLPPPSPPNPPRRIQPPRAVRNRDSTYDGVGLRDHLQSESSTQEEGSGLSGNNDR